MTTTATAVQQNAKVTERIIKPTDKNIRQDGTTPSTDKGHWNTVRTPVYTTTPVQQNARITGRMSKPTDKNPQQAGTTPAAEQAQWQSVMLIVICIMSACPALFVLYKAVAACRKRYKRRQNQRQYIQGNAAGAIGGIPLQNIQPPAAAPTTGNPLPPQQANDAITDDTSIDPYAETSRLENPVYGADVTEPKCATSIPDPRPRPGRPINSASSRPRRPRIGRAGKAPDPPPRSDGPVDASDSHYYPPATKTTKTGKVPALPPRTHHTYVNSNVSSQPPDTATTQTEKIPDPFPRTHTYVNSNVSSQAHGSGMASTSQHGAMADRRAQGSGMDGEEEAEVPNIYLDLNDKSRLSASKMHQAGKVPDPLPRTHTYVNSNISSLQKDSKMPKQMPRSEAPSDKPQRQIFRLDEEEEVEGPNIYLNLNL
ncbi:Hypp7926 [Branchiostoma lanceolatum]|uniref:Hypp7926 protein n=1 Tax=Branchiostoma lanceolatum TaxID=7740 RepID=A0A8K0EGC8_BRALA|nr:Hypp7926 [Branchiostoma lanceolatum]